MSIARTQHSPPPTIATGLRDLASSLDFARFHRMVEQSLGEGGQQGAEAGFLATCYEKMAQEAVRQGEYFLAYDCARHGLRCAAAAGFPPHELKVEELTALARTGATEKALELAEDFLRDERPTARLASAMARLHRDRALGAATEADRRKFLRLACGWAAEALKIAEREGGDQAYPAGQLAQYALLAGELREAHGMARKVIRRVNREIGRDGKRDNFWNQTNLAEMALVLGDLESAGRHYKAAASLGTNTGHLAANRLVAELLLRELRRRNPQINAAVIEEWFIRPVVAVFSGHMPDGAHTDGKKRPHRLPEVMCRPGGPAAKAIAAWLGKNKVREGICATAPGGDILFSEQVLVAGGRLQLVEPFGRERQEAAAEHCGHDWSARLAKVWAAAGRCETVHCAEGADLAMQCQYANRVMIGSAMLRARQTGGTLRALLLWENRGGKALIPGGAAEFAGLCKRAGVPVDIINPGELT